MYEGRWADPVEENGEDCSTESVPSNATAPIRERQTSMGSALHFDDPALLRAARVADMLRGGGRIFGSRAGTEDTYKLSRPVDHIDVFISHSWALGRARKFVLLALHFNLDLAVKSAVVAIIVGACITYSAVKRGHVQFAERFPIVCLCAGVAFTAALLFGHEARALLGLRGERVFLDKVCIHQTDEALKERGIRCLGAFLHHSSSLVVCFTELYLKRLWTVYELASFILVHGENWPGTVHVLPADLPIFVLATTFLLFAGIVLDYAGMAIGMHVLIMKLLVVAVSLLIVVGLARKWARQQHEACAMFKGFALADTTCESESDRGLVRKNIIALMRHFSPVGAHATEEDALLAFDEFVRAAGPQAFAASVGGLGCPYKLLIPSQLIILSDSIHLWIFGIGLSAESHRTEFAAALILIAHLGGSFCMVPLGVALGLYLSKLGLRLRGAAEVVYCGAVAGLIVALLVTIDPISGWLHVWLLDAALYKGGVVNIVLYLLYMVGLFAVTAIVYRQPQQQAGVSLGLPRDRESVQVEVGDEEAPTVAMLDDVDNEADAPPTVLALCTVEAGKLDVVEMR